MVAKRRGKKWRSEANIKRLSRNMDLSHALSALKVVSVVIPTMPEPEKNASAFIRAALLGGCIV
jgi:hypothetical protein